VELSRTRNLRNSCIIRGSRGEVEVGVGPRGPVTLRADGAEMTAAPAIKAQEPPSPLDATRLQLEEFADAVSGGRDCPLFAEHTVETIRLYDACKAGHSDGSCRGRSTGRPAASKRSRSHGAGARRHGLHRRTAGRGAGAQQQGEGARAGQILLPAAGRLSVRRRGDDRRRDRRGPSLSAALAGCDVVFNCTYGRGSREAAALVNVEAVKTLVLEASRARVGRVVHLSTVSAYGLPPDGELREESLQRAPRSHVYGFTKWQGEQTGLAAAREGAPRPACAPADGRVRPWRAFLDRQPDPDAEVGPGRAGQRG